MKMFRNIRNELARRVIASFSCFALVTCLLAQTLLPIAAQTKQAVQSRQLTDQQRILHVLNRLGFGARPGDVERVREMGLENYINQQLNPEKIPDTIADSKVKDLESLHMTTAQLYEKYPQPGQFLRQLQARGVLPSDLAQARDNRVKGGANAAPASMPKTGDQIELKAETVDVVKNPNPNDNGNPLNNDKYRQAIREYYLQNGLQQPQRIVAELQASRILRAVYGERQLQEVMVDFWTNHFNVFAGKGADRWLLPAYDRDTIRPNAMSKFSTLLTATAQSPAMLFYLDNFQSVSPNAPRGGGLAGLQRPRERRASLPGVLIGGQRGADVMINRPYPAGAQQTATNMLGANMPRPAKAAKQQKRGINENYARELMELHTLGVDGGYTQKDVQEVARCFTGWTIFAPRGAGAAANALMGEAGREKAGTFFFNARTHDDGEKIVLGHKIPSGGGMRDGLMVLDILAHHPATAKFIATKLLRHFVSDNPPPALVDQVAAVFTKSDGDIRETLRAIFFSAEFNSQDAYRAKIKRPFELVVSAIRTLGGDTNGGPQLHQWIARMGEPLYGFQTPNGYSDTAESWVNTGGLLERMNFGLALASNRVQGTQVNLNRFVTSSAKGESVDKSKMMDDFLLAILAGDISPKTRQALLKQVNEQAAVTIPAMPVQMEPAADTSQMDGPGLQRQQRPRMDANITDPVTRVAGLILGSPEFQRQ